MIDGGQALPEFGVQLAKLAQLRGLDVVGLAGPTAADTAATRSVLDGADPDPSLLLRLAPVLDLHSSDLFVIAGLPVPAELTPLDRTGSIGSLAWGLTYLPGAVQRLHEFITDQPQMPRSRPPSPPPPPHRQYPNGAGGLVVRLMENRNLPWSGANRFLFGIGRGPMLSASTIGGIGSGRKELTPDLLARFAAFLDISARDLSALTGVDQADPGPVHPAAARVAALIWDARRLSAAQLSAAHDLVHVIRHERAADIDPLRRCSCPGPAQRGHLS